ncbi:acireductone synthase [Blastopirellula retiformator]|uniref:Enolase-phosphatase E1 n=1 Tax=Blastopirellula retiformator TaxID=2527970 RepID=A0A5C5V087_9BACT|nr:acireductone synthase [Blastopirellula retiformator]TWT32016.1 Enolase-phosphatase E1 [Blastopirellula retiformator]
MIEFYGRGLLLDIEGTTASVAFVYDVMFPFVRRELDAYLESAWGTPELELVLRYIAQDAGSDSFAEWTQDDATEEAKRQRVSAEMTRLMDDDVKATGLKQLQGLIWKAGFDSGELVAAVFDDVPDALERWNAAGKDVRIYSSGSVAAQKMFFEHTNHGNLLPMFQGHYDTTTGPKKEAQSYRTIAGDFDFEPSQILFLSDVVAELDAAREAGMRTGLCYRPGNAPVENANGHTAIESFDQISIG